MGKRKLDNGLKEAVEFNNVGVAGSCLYQGANITACYDNGQSLLFKAANNNNKEMVKLLLDYGADPYSIKDQQGYDTWSLFDICPVDENILSFLDGYIYGIESMEYY